MITFCSKLANFLAMLDTRMTTLGPMSWHLQNPSPLSQCKQDSVHICRFHVGLRVISGSDLELNDCPRTEGFDLFIFVMLQAILTRTKIKQPKPHYT